MSIWALSERNAARGSATGAHRRPVCCFRARENPARARPPRPRPGRPRPGAAPHPGSAARPPQLRGRPSRLQSRARPLGAPSSPSGHCWARGLPPARRPKDGRARRRPRLPGTISGRAVADAVRRPRGGRGNILATGPPGGAVIAVCKFRVARIAPIYHMANTRFALVLLAAPPALRVRHPLSPGGRSRLGRLRRDLGTWRRRDCAGCCGHGGATPWASVGRRQAPWAAAPGASTDRSPSKFAARRGHPGGSRLAGRALRPGAGGNGRLRQHNDRCGRPATGSSDAQRFPSPTVMAWPISMRGR